jgi:hypothetical protein
LGPSSGSLTKYGAKTQKQHRILHSTTREFKVILKLETLLQIHDGLHILYACDE